jgi:hypothetical protein
MTDYIGAGMREKTEMLAENLLYKLHTSIPALISDVNLEKQTLSAEIAVKFTVDDEREMSWPVLRNIPFFTLQNGSYSVTVPPKPGDACLLLFCERNADSFWANGKVSAPTYAKTRRHDVNDAVALIGFTPTTKLIKDYAADAIEMRNTSRSSAVSVKTGEITVNVGEKKGSNTVVLSANSGENNSITLTADNKSRIAMRNERLQLESGEEIKITLTPEGISISTGGKPVTFDVSDVVIRSSNNIDFESSNAINFKSEVFNVEANTNLKGDVSIDGSSLKVNAATEISGNTKITGAVSVKGDLDAVLLKGPHIDRRGAATEATAGKLTTGDLYAWNDFADRLTLEGKLIHFELTAAQTDFTISIPFDDIKAFTGWSDLAKLIESFSQNLFTVDFDADENSLNFTTTGTGKEQGNLTFLRDITISSDSSPGVLTSGELTDWSTFLSSLNGLGLIFKINIAGSYKTYALDFDKISGETDFAGFTEILNGFYPDLVTVSFADNKITFTTIGFGSMNGSLSYLTPTSSAASSAVFTGGNFDPDFSEFKTELKGYDLALSSKINGRDYIFYMSYSDIENLSGYADFFSNLFSASPMRADTGYQNVVLTTKDAGSSTSIGFFDSVTHLDATAAYLQTGTLQSFIAVKNLYANQPLNIIFNFKVDHYDNNYAITPQNLKDASDWGDIAAMLSPSGDETTPINISFGNGTLTFASPTTGERMLSYLQYNPDPDVKSIDGSLLLSGTEQFASIYRGTNENDHLSPESANLLKLTEATGAVTVNGTDSAYNPNSVDLMKGTEATEAVLQQGVDGNITVINNSATLLKGTKNTDAVLNVGLDPGEEDPASYDRVMTIVGSLNVIEKISCKEFTVSEKTSITGEVNIKPQTVPEDESVPPEPTDVVVDGGIKSKKLTVSETATVNELKVNAGAEITGDLTLDGGKIISGGIQLSFDFSGMKCTGTISASDFVAGF